MGRAASIALFFASDEAANFTGQDIDSGGGVMWQKFDQPLQEKQ